MGHSRAGYFDLPLAGNEISYWGTGRQTSKTWGKMFEVDEPFPIW